MKQSAAIIYVLFVVLFIGYMVFHFGRFTERNDLGPRLQLLTDCNNAITIRMAYEDDTKVVLKELEEGKIC